MDLKPTPKARQLLANKFNRAKALYGEGKPGEARSVCQSILVLDPNHVDALQFFGFLAKQMGDLDEALKLLRKAVDLQPDNIQAVNNLGNVLLDRGDLAEAEACYRQVIEKQPQGASNYSNLCVVLRQQGRLDEAIQAGQTAVRLDPDSAMGWYSVGNAFKVAGRLREAIDCYQRSIDLKPQQPITHDALCQATYRLEGKSLFGRRRWKKTIRAYKQWLAVDPNQPLAIQMLESLKVGGKLGGGKLARAPDAVIRAQFDQSAPRFESRLKKLQYRVPELVDTALQQHLGAGNANLAVLDGGCGTGWCAPSLKRYASRLVGVDLSGEMLRLANETGLYDELIEQELTAFLKTQSGRFDLALYADTLCYFGDLGEVITATANALRAEGMLVFSVEQQATGSGYELHPNGRYTHARSHVEKVLKKGGFSIVACTEEVLRLELGRDVAGMMVVARLKAV